MRMADVIRQLAITDSVFAEIEDPNVLCITVTPQAAHFKLWVLPVDGSTAVDQELVLE